MIADQLLAAPQHAHVARAQKTEPGLELGLERVLADGEPVVPDPQEGEIVGDQPFEELNGFGDLVDRQLRRISLERRHDLADARQHWAPILHAEPDIGERAFERRDDVAARAVVVDASHMDMDEAFARRARHVPAADKQAVGVAGHEKDRMHHQPDIETALGKLAQHGVDQERHVVIEDLEDRDVLEPLRPAGRALLEADLRGAGLAPRQERPRRLRQCGDLGRRVAQDVLRHGATEQRGHEVLRHIGAMLARERRGRLDQGLRGGLVPRTANCIDRHGFARLRRRAIPACRPVSFLIHLVTPQVLERKCFPSAMPRRAGRPRSFKELNQARKPTWMAATLR